MRFAAAFCFLTVLCTVYANLLSNELDNLKFQIKNAERIVENAIQQLEYVRIETEEDTLMTVTKKWWEQQDSHRDFANLGLASMRREVNNAKLKGVDAQKCYDANSYGIYQSTEKAYTAGLKCKNSAETSIKNSLNFLDNLRSLGDTLIDDLNNIILDCHGKEALEMQSCVLIKLRTLESTIKSFEDKVKYIGFNAMTVSNSVVLQATKCLSNVYLLARYDSQDAMNSHSRCVQDLQKKNLIV